MVEHHPDTLRMQDRFPDRAHSRSGHIPGQDAHKKQPMNT